MRQGDVLPKFGNAFQVKAWKGRLYVAKWPKPRGKNLPHLTKVRNKWFKLVNDLSKYTTPGQMRAAMKLAPHGALYPRDYLVSAMAGRMYTIQLDTGETLYPMSLKNEISKDLDVITPIPGSLLYRGTQLWEPVAPGVWGQSLQPNQTTGLPEWVDREARQSGLNTSAMVPTSANTNAEATMGWWAFLEQKIIVEKLIPTWSRAVGINYQCTIATLNVWTIDEIIARTNVHDGVTTSFARFGYTPDSMPVLTQGVKYAFLFTRTSNTGTTSCNLYDGAGTGQKGIPLSHNTGSLAFTTTLPSVGQTASRNDNSKIQQPIDLLYRM